MSVEARRIVAASKWKPLSPEEVRSLVSKGVGDSAGGVTREAVLDTEQEREFRVHGFKSRLPLHLTDEREGQSYIVFIAGVRLALDPSHFLLVLRLATQLFRDMEGVSKEELGKGFLAPDHIEPAIGNVRKALKPALGDLKGTDLIEAYEKGKIRLSTHPAYIAVEVEALIAGKDGRIAALAKEITTLAAARKTRPV